MNALTIGIILALSAGTAVAAETTGPGDMLYPIKTQVNERVQSAFAVSAESEARLNTELAEERLEEAAELAVEGNLTTEIRIKLQTMFEAHITEAQERIAELRTENDLATAAKASAELESTLDANADALIELRGQVDSQTEVHVDALLSLTLAHASTVANTNADISAQLSTQAESNTNTQQSLEILVESEIRSAENAIEDAENAIASAEVHASAISRAEARITTAVHILTEARASLELEAYTDAREEAREARTTARSIIINLNSLEIGADANSGINIDITTSESNSEEPDDSTSSDDTNEVDVEADTQSETSVESDTAGAESNNDTSGGINISY